MAVFHLEYILDIIFKGDGKFFLMKIQRFIRKSKKPRFIKQYLVETHNFKFSGKE